MTRLDVDVVTTHGELQSTVVSVFAREADHPCSCNSFWPAPGTCQELDPSGSCTCQPSPASCLTSVRIERSGEVQAEVTPNGTSGDDELDLFPSGLLAIGDVLVLEGCGGEAVVPLSPLRAPAPEITEVTTSATEVHVAWHAPSPAEGALARLWTPSGFRVCHARAGERLGLSRADSDVHATLYMAALADGTAHETPIGTVRVWDSNEMEAAELYLPRSLGDGWWTIPFGAEASGTLVLDSMSSRGYVLLDEGHLTFRTDEPDVNGALRVVAAFQAVDTGTLYPFEYTTGPVTDSLTMTIDGDTYQADIPHAVPYDPFELGSVARNGYGVYTDSHTLSSSTATRQVGIEFMFDMPGIARPE